MSIHTRQRRMVNTDPQRRCYNGCNKSEALIWSEWELLDYDDSEDRLLFWQGLNDYAVRERGESARREFKVQPCHC